MKYFDTETIGFILPHGVYEASDFNLMLKSLLPDEVKINNTIDDIRLKPNLTFIKTLRFTEKSFFFTILGFTQSHFYALNDIDGFYQLIAGSYKCNEPIKIKGIDKNQLKGDCNNGSFLKVPENQIIFFCS